MKTRPAAEIWKAALDELQGKVSPANYQTWLKNTVGLTYSDSCFTVGVSSSFVTESLEKRLHPLIEKTLIGITGKPLSVQFQVHLGNGDEELTPPVPSTPSSTNYKQRTGAPKLNRKYTFSSFIVGSSNRLAHAAALGVAENPGNSYNPLFVYSGVGLGKTHLLHAIGWEAIRVRPRVMYVTAEQFTNEFISAIRERRSEDFRDKYRSVDVLLLDDIQFIAGKEQTQEGLFHTFNALHTGNSQIVISCDRPPKSLTLLEDRLRSRFEWGLIVDMQPPDLETRIAILQTKAEEQKTGAPPEVLNFIARRIQKNIRELEGALNRVMAYARLTKSPLTVEVLNFIARRIQKNIRELEGALNRVMAYARLTQSPLTVELATQALADISSDAHKRTLTPTVIRNVVATFFNIPPETLQGKRRDKTSSQARQIAMYLLREELQCSWTQIGRELGNRDHSTILHGYHKISDEVNTDHGLRRDLLEIRENLYSKSA
ncbi:MAG: chromosomal replication initiator protein DnaA [Chloroflexi bacterium]|nr:chromosomal replication initiator protein DnaA [Chloroflexota bacterium]